MAAAVAVTQATTPIHLITDSEYLLNGIRALITNEELEADAKNLDKWWRIQQHLRKIHRVDWIKGHRAPEQAKALGFSEEDRLGNEQADVLATRGLTEHHEGEAEDTAHTSGRSTNISCDSRPGWRTTSCSPSAKRGSTTRGPSRRSGSATSTRYHTSNGSSRR